MSCYSNVVELIAPLKTICNNQLTDTAAHSRPTYAEREGFKTCWHGLSPPLKTCPPSAKLLSGGTDTIDDGYDPIDNYMVSTPCILYHSRTHLTHHSHTTWLH